MRVISSAALVAAVSLQASQAAEAAESAPAFRGRGLVQGGNGQATCDNPNGCWWGASNGAYIEGLWVTHPRIHWRCASPEMVALTFDDG
jgi:hypothetical protein